MKDIKGLDKWKRLYNCLSCKRKRAFNVFSVLMISIFFSTFFTLWCDVTPANAFSFCFPLWFTIFFLLSNNIRMCKSTWLFSFLSDAIHSIMMKILKEFFTQARRSKENFPLLNDVEWSLTPIRRVMNLQLINFFAVH